MIFSKKKILSLSFFVLFLWGVVLSTFATPPASPFTPADNITDPTCAPGEFNCYVVSGSGSSQWDDVTGGINYAGGNVGIGTTTPNSALDVVGTFNQVDGVASIRNHSQSLSDISFFGTDFSGVASVYKNPLGYTALSANGDFGGETVSIFGNIDSGGGITGVFTDEGDIDIMSDSSLYPNYASISLRDSSGGSFINLRARNVAIDGSEGLKLPEGTTAERSLSPSNGTVRFNTDLDCLEIFKSSNTSWTCLGGGGSSQWDTVTGGINYAGGNVGVGTTTPNSALDIRYAFSITTTQDNFSPSLDDATFSGTYTGSIDDQFYVYVDSEGTPDTFSWYDSMGQCPGGSGIPITGGPQLLCKGIYVTFGATTGHLNYDTWDYNISLSAPVASNQETASFAVLDDAAFLGTYTGSTSNIIYIYRQ